MADTDHQGALKGQLFDLHARERGHDVYAVRGGQNRRVMNNTKAGGGKKPIKSVAATCGSALDCENCDLLPDSAKGRQTLTVFDILPGNFVYQQGPQHAALILRA